MGTLGLSRYPIKSAIQRRSAHAVKAVPCRKRSKDCYWPNSVGHDQQSGQPQPAQAVNSTRIRSIHGPPDE